jgi:hypothetical protein
VSYQIKETLKRLRSARKSLDTLIKTLEGVSACGLQDKDVDSARRLAARWVENDRTGKPDTDGLDIDQKPAGSL